MMLAEMSLDEKAKCLFEAVLLVTNQNAKGHGITKDELTQRNLSIDGKVYRQVICKILAKYLRIPYKEIADILDTTEHTVTLYINADMGCVVSMEYKKVVVMYERLLKSFLTDNSQHVTFEALSEHNEEKDGIAT